MKKIPLLLLALFLVCSSFTDRRSPFLLNFNNDQGKAIYFVIQNPNEYNALDKLSAALGKPASSNTGIIVWKHVDIGVAKDVTITVRDGILTHDPVAHTGEWIPFTSAADKKEKLAHMHENQDRMTEVAFTGKDGKGFTADGAIEHRLQSFLEASIQF